MGNDAMSYTGRDIQVLRGLEPVRLRPGMFIGNTSSTGLHHLFTEVLDNAVDEALNGYCDHIQVVIGADNTITVSDNGRGIPVDRHSQSARNTLEIIMTSLHSGGKFSTKSYKISGGLHGVGVSVVNALSEFLRVISKRDGMIWQQDFARGKRKSKLLNLGPTSEQGTTVIFRPDPDIFKDLGFSPRIIKEQAKAKAFLTRGLAISIDDQINGSKEVFFFKEGIKDYIKDLLGDKEPVTEEPFYFNYENDLRLEMALWWTTATERSIYSYANSVYTSGGGSHENGFRSGITRAVREYIGRQNNQRKGKSVSGEDVREGLVAVFSVFVSGNLEFQGQTKERLNSDIQSQVESLVKDAFENYLFHNRSAAEAIVDRILLAAQAREASRQARQSISSKRAATRLTLPGKLADCASGRVEETELFIVEGDSAGGSSKQARDRRFQAVLPLRGKILNVEQASADKIRRNREIQDLINCIGTGAGDSFNYSALRYGKIFINCDADVDGFHISTLLLTFFYRYTPELIEKGHIYLAQPPLYRIRVGNGKRQRVHYVYREEDKEKLLKRLSGQGISIQRFKGLGEMNAAELKETTMDPDKRLAFRVTVEDAARTNEVFEALLGRDPARRYAFIQGNAAFVREIDA